MLGLTFLYRYKNNGYLLYLPYKYISMKYFIIAIALLFLGISVYSQNLKPSAAVTNDFVTSFYYQYKYQKSSGVRSCAFITGQQMGYNLVDLEVAVEEMAKNNKFRELLYKVMFNLYKGDEEFFTLNLISIGMKAANAKVLSKYVLNKYGKNAIQSELLQANPDSNIIDPVSKISTLNYINLKNIFTLKNLIRVFGKENIIEKIAYNENGEEFGKRYVLFEGTVDVVSITFVNHGMDNFITFSEKQAKWKLPYNLVIGMSLNDVVNLNARNFYIYGFEWDYSGRVTSWNKGKLANKNFTLSFRADENIDQLLYAKYSGEKEYYTSNLDFQKLNLYIAEITLHNKHK